MDQIQESGRKRSPPCGRTGKQIPDRLRGVNPDLIKLVLLGEDFFRSQLLSALDAADNEFAADSHLFTDELADDVII